MRERESLTLADLYLRWSSVQGQVFPEHEKDLTYWHVALIEPIVEALRESDRFESVESAGPFGLNARVMFKCRPVPFEGKDLTMTLEPCLEISSFGSCLGWVDYSIDTGDYAKGTIGALNGGNHPVSPVPLSMRIDDVDGWVEFMSEIRAK